jgi:hypothetical protein
MVWPTHVSNLTRFLITCRKVFGGDIDMFLVLAVIGDRTFSQRHADQALDYEAFRYGRGEKTPSLDINLRSIADFSGIPRETVRRKINQLLKAGMGRQAARRVTAGNEQSQDRSGTADACEYPVYLRNDAVVR